MAKTNISVKDKLTSLRLSDQFVDLSGKKIGAFTVTAKKVYNLDADYFILNGLQNVQLDRIASYGIRREQLIYSFFVWDYELDKKYRPEENYIKFLTERLLPLGINKVCQMDFSVFYQDSIERRNENMYLNFKYARIAQDLGFKVILNFNNILDNYFDIYRQILPLNIHSVIIDDNHTEDRYAQREDMALKQLVEQFNLSTVILRTGKRKLLHRKYLYKLLQTERGQGMNIQFMPTEYTFLTWVYTKKHEGKKAVR